MIYDMIWYGLGWYDMIWYICWYIMYDIIWYDIWYYMVWYVTIWYDIYDIFVDMIYIIYDMLYDMIYLLIWYGMIYCIWYDIFVDMIWYIIYDTIYLLTAIGLSPGGSSTVHIYIQTIHRTTQNKQYTEQHNELIWKSAGHAPSLRVAYS